MADLSILKSKKIFIPLGALIIFIAVLSYFSMWRPSDSDYDTASQLLKAADGTSKAVTVELATIKYPGDITAATPLKLGVLANISTKSLEALDTSAPFTRDFSLRATYEMHRSKITEHKLAIAQIASSIQKYTNALGACRAFTDKFTKQTESTYSDLLSRCQSALDEAKKSEYKQFNDQFLNKYLQLTSEYIKAIDSRVLAQDEATFMSAHEKITNLSQEIGDLGAIELDFKLSNISSPLKDLTSKVENQKKALLR